MTVELENKKLQYFCGEAPILDPATGLLWVVDTGNPVCAEIAPETGNIRELRADGNLQCLGLRKGGGWIAVLEDDVVLCDDKLEIIKRLGNPVEGQDNMVLGDGTAGPDGCFYFGAFNCEDLYSKQGCVFRVNRDLTIDKVIDGLALPNGMAFSCDGTKFYLTEMFAGCIWSFCFNEEEGTFTEKNKFADIPEEKGLPDGLIIDAEDCLWSAHWAGFRITRYSPDGTVDREIDMPVPTPTCMGFAGKDMNDLYITTARKGLSDEELREYPDSGDLFILKTETMGRTELYFEG